jgi:cell division protein FtsL
MSDQQLDQWHLDKRVPLALIWTIAAQTLVVIVAGTLFYSDMQQTRRDVTRIETATERRIDRLDQQVVQITSAANQQAIQLGRIEEIMAGMRGDMRRLIALWENGATP